MTPRKRGTYHHHKPLAARNRTPRGARMNPFLKALLALAALATGLGAVAGYISYRLFVHHIHAVDPCTVVVDVGIGPVRGWYFTWLAASTAGFVVGMPRALVKAWRAQGQGRHASL
jgi:hypothetical protein